MAAHGMWRLAAALALSACGQTDPLAQARADCANAASAPQARIAACTGLIESGELGEVERAIALANRGSARGEGGDVTAGLRDYEAALAADADNMLAIMGRASVLIASGQIDAAQPLVRRLIASGEYADQAQLFAGQVAAQRGDLAAAITAYDAAIAANPRLAAAFTDRGRVKQSLEDYAGALADYDAALRIDPRLAPALAGRCWVRVRQEDGDMALARADADAAATADRANTQGQLCRGLLQLRAGEWAAARASYEAVLEGEPGNPTALFGRGIARRRGGDDAGTADMNQARDFSRNIDQSFNQLGVRTY